MDILLNLADSHDKLDLNISDIIQNISNQVTNLTNILDNTTNMLINYTSDDLICMNDINIQRIDKLKYNFINEIKYFMYNLSQIDDNIDKFIIDELIDIITNQELSILRLENLLTNDINNYIKTTKNIINNDINNILNEYNVRDKLCLYYINNNDDMIKNFMNEIENNIFPSGNIKIDNIYNNEQINIKNKIEFESILKNKFTDIEFTENTDNFYKWNKDIILYEINNYDNTKKIYIYLDIFNRDNSVLSTDNYIFFDKNEKRKIIDLDINKIFCIINNDGNFNMVYNYVCMLISSYIL